MLLHILKFYVLVLASKIFLISKKKNKFKNYNEHFKYST